MITRSSKIKKAKELIEQIEDTRSIWVIRASLVPNIINILTHLDTVQNAEMKSEKQQKAYWKFRLRLKTMRDNLQMIEYKHIRQRLNDNSYHYFSRVSEIIPDVITAIDKFLGLRAVDRNYDGIFQSSEADFLIEKLKDLHKIEMQEYPRLKRKVSKIDDGLDVLRQGIELFNEVGIEAADLEYVKNIKLLKMNRKDRRRSMGESTAMESTEISEYDGGDSDNGGSDSGGEVVVVVSGGGGAGGSDVVADGGGYYIPGDDSEQMTLRMEFDAMIDTLFQRATPETIESIMVIIEQAMMIMSNKKVE